MVIEVPGRRRALPYAAGPGRLRAPAAVAVLPGMLLAAAVLFAAPPAGAEPFDGAPPREAESTWPKVPAALGLLLAGLGGLGFLSWRRRRIGAG